MKTRRNPIPTPTEFKMPTGLGNLVWMQPKKLHTGLFHNQSPPAHLEARKKGGF